MIFDYIDGAAGEGHGEALNRAVMRNIRLRPSVLVNVEHRSLNINVLNHQTKRPFGICPMGMCNMKTPDADLMLARLAATMDCVQVGFGIFRPQLTYTELPFQLLATMSVSVSSRCIPKY